MRRPIPALRKAVAALTIATALAVPSGALATGGWGHPVRVSGKSDERFDLSGVSTAKGGLAAVSWISGDRNHFGRYNAVVAIRGRGQHHFTHHLRMRAGRGDQPRFIASQADNANEVVIAWLGQNKRLRTGIYDAKHGRLVHKRSLGPATDIVFAARPDGRAILAWSKGHKSYASRRRAGAGFTRPIKIRNYKPNAYGYGVNLNDRGDASFYWFGGWGLNGSGYYIAGLKHGTNHTGSRLRVRGSGLMTGEPSFALTNSRKVYALLDGAGDTDINVTATIYRPGKGFTEPETLARDEFDSTVTVDARGNAIGVWDGDVSRQGIETTQMLLPAGGSWGDRRTIFNRSYARDDRSVVAAPNGKALLITRHKGRYVALTGTVRKGLRAKKALLSHASGASQMQAALANSGRGVAAFKRGRGVFVVSRKH